MIHFPSLFQCFFAVSSCLSVHFAGVTQMWKTQQLTRSWLAIRLLDTLSTSPYAFQATHLILAKERSFQGVGWWWPENDGLYFSCDVEDDPFKNVQLLSIDKCNSFNKLGRVSCGHWWSLTQRWSDTWKHSHQRKCSHTTCTQQFCQILQFYVKLNLHHVKVPKHISFALNLT